MNDDQAQHLLMMQTVAKSAYATLANRLSQHGLIDLSGLAADLEMLAEVQDDPVWRTEYLDYADMLHACESLPSNIRQ